MVLQSRLAELSDGQLVAMSQEGDREAFGQLVRRYQRLVLHVAYHTGADSDQSQDIAQDVFLRAWQALPTFHMRAETSFRSWICRIASNRTVDLLRKGRATAQLDVLDLPGGVQPEAVQGQQERVQMVRDAMSRLPASSRQALVLRAYGDLSYREISEALDVPIGTVMSRLSYARSRLRRELERQRDT